MYFFFFRGVCGYFGHVPFFHDNKSETSRNVVSYAQGTNLLETELHTLYGWLFSYHVTVFDYFQFSHLSVDAVLRQALAV